MKYHLAILAWITLGCDGSSSSQTPSWSKFDGAAYPQLHANLPWPSAGPLALTSDNGADTLTAFDPLTGQLLARVPVGRDPVGIDGPHHLAVDRKAGFVYVALAYPAPAIAPGPHAAHGSSSRSGYIQKLRLADLELLAEQPIDSNPGDIVLSADGSTLVTTHFDLAQALKPGPLDLRRSTLTWLPAAGVGSKAPLTVRVCVLPHGAALTPDGHTAWIACYGEDAVAVVDLTAQPPVVTRIAAGADASDSGTPNVGPYSIVPNPLATLAAVGCTESRDVRIFDLKTHQFGGLRWHEAGAGQPYFGAWAPDGASLWIPTQGPDAVALVDAATMKSLQVRQFVGTECLKPHELQLVDNGPLLVVCEGDHVGPGQVLALDPASLKTLWSVQTGAYPDRLAIGRLP